MKKLLWLTLATGLIFACASSPKTGDQLDAAIRETSDYLNTNLTAGGKIAFLNIQSDYPTLSEYIIDELIANTVNDKIFSVVDRQQLDAIRAEQNFQMSGEVDDSTAQEMGRLLGAQTIISGGVTKIGDMYRLRVRALNVQSAQIEGQFNRNITNSSTVDALTQSGTRTAAGSTTGNRPANQTRTQATPAAPATPAAAAYSVGQTGHAGGLIFAGSRNSAGVWTYYEVAPVEAEFQARWSVDRSTMVDNTQESIGSGRRNTQLIVQTFSQTQGEWDTAAQKCAELSFGEFNDWYLPSKGELDQMYGQLKRRNLGDFKNGWYWSSSQEGGIFAYCQNFQDGRSSSGTGMNFKNYTHYVRPIRSFTQ